MTTSKKVSKHALCDVPDSGKTQVTFPKKGSKPPPDASSGE